MKTVSQQLVEKNPGKFTNDFQKNKEILNNTELFDFSKKTRNKVAGCIVTTIKKKKL